MREIEKTMDKIEIIADLYLKWILFLPLTLADKAKNKVIRGMSFMVALLIIVPWLFVFAFPFLTLVLIEAFLSFINE